MSLDPRAIAVQGIGFTPRLIAVHGLGAAGGEQFVGSGRVRRLRITMPDAMMDALWRRRKKRRENEILFLGK